MPAFQALPTELILRVCIYLQDRDVLRLSETSRSLLALSRSDDVWKPRTKQLWTTHGLGSAVANEQDQGWGAWRNLYGPYARYLGLWASHLPFRGRLLCSNLINGKIVVSHVSALNAASHAELLGELPVGAALVDPLERSYLLGQGHPSPERGLSVDVFKPEVRLSPLFVITPGQAPQLLRSPGVTLDLSLAATSTPVSCDLARHGQSLQEALEEESLAGRFPTAEMARNDMLRGASLGSTKDEPLAIQCHAMSWTTAKTEEPSEPVLAAAAASTAARPRATATTQPVQVQTVRDAAERFIQQHLPRRHRYGLPAFAQPSVPAQAEQFFPLAQWFDAKPLAPQTTCPPQHLEGLWVGTFGPHGTEFGWVHSRWEEDEAIWVIEYIKVTGDVNVPSGVVSWCAALDGDKVPTVRREDLDKWNKSSLTQMQEVGEKWEEGTVDAYGQVAFSGFVQPRQSTAKVTFVRQDDAVNEIRFRWSELGKVSIFRRTQPSQITVPHGLEW